MKKLLLIFICALSFTLNVRSQNVANTYWVGVVDSTDTPDLYWHFTADSLYYSADNVNWTIVSFFTENTGTFNITDVPPATCSYTGTYGKTIIGDTLWLSLLNDTCSSRVDYLTSHYFVNTITNVEETPLQNSVTIAPNPSAGTFVVNCSETPLLIVVRDISGRVVREEPASSNQLSISLESSPAGIYFVTVIFENSSSTQKIAVE